MQHAAAETHRQKQAQLDTHLGRVSAEFPDQQRRRPGAHGIVDE